MGKVERTDIKLGDVVNGHVSEAQAIEKMAMVLDHNTDVLESVKGKAVANKEVLYGKDGKPGLISDLEVTKARVGWHSRLIFGFIIVVALSLLGILASSI